MPYYFEKEQNLKFIMIDGDGNGDYDVIGEVITTMGKVMGAPVFTENLTHKGKSNCG